MDWERLNTRVQCVWKKYRFAAIILLLGIVLMLAPGEKEKSVPESIKVEQNNIPTDLKTTLEKTLSQLDGAGRVQVILTEASGEEIIYQSNENISTQGDTLSERRETVIIADGQRTQNGLIRQINPPHYLGAVVLCQGAENPSVRLSISQAVSSLTGLTFNKIAILKSK